MLSIFMVKIAATLIVKDDSEAEILRRCLKTICKYVDKIFITGTQKPQKKIKAVCKEFNADWSWFAWTKDFSAARNFNFAQVPMEYEWIFWCDTDDVVMGAETFQRAIDIADKNNIKAIFCRYLYQVELDEQNNVKNILIEHLRERLIRNDGTYQWIAPIHETLIERVPSGKTDYNGFMVIHMMKPEEMENSLYRNIEILEEEVMRNPEDPRPIYYLAKAYFDTKEPKILYESVGPELESIAVELIKDYLEKSGWAEERAQAWEYLSMIYREMGDYKRGISTLLEALTEDPKFISIYIQLALCYVALHDWSKALQWIKLAGTIEIPKTTLVINPRDYKTMILEALFHIYLNTGQLELCQKTAQGLTDLVPNDLTKARLKDITDLKHRNDLAHWIVNIAQHLKDTNQKEELQTLVMSIPQEIANEPVLVQLRNEFIKPKEWESNEIAIFCGPHFEKWSPKSVATGIGGSEEAVIYMSKELTRLGWKVTVFNDPREDAGIYDGVNYLPHYYLNWKDKFNIFISWRHIEILDAPIRAERVFLWNHDIQNPLTYTPERIDKLTKAFFLSKWHRDNVPNLPEDKVMITANGVNI